MARVPVYSDLQVAPSNVPQISYGRQENLFSGIGQGLELAGESMQRIAEINKQREDELAHTQYLEAANMRAADIQTLKTKFAQTAGKDAVAKQPEYEAELQKINDKYAGMVSNNKLAAEKYRITAIPAFSDANGFFTTHAYKEKERYDSEVDKTALQNYNRAAVDNFHQNGTLGQEVQLNLADEVIRRNGMRNGKDESVIANEIAANRSMVHTTAVDSLIGREQYQAAKKYFDDNASSILVEDREKLNQMFARIKDTDRYRSEGNAKYAELKKTYGNDFGKILDGMTEYTVGMKDSRQAEYVMTLARQRISDAKIAQSDAELRTLQGLEQKLATTNGYPDDSFWKSPEFIAAPYNIQQEIRRRQESSSYTINDAVLLNELESDMSKAQTLGDWRAIDAKLATNATKLRPDTFKAFAARSSSMKASVTNQDAGPDAKDMQMFHRVLEQSGITNWKKVSEYEKTGSDAFKKVLNWETGFINWRSANKDKPLTQADISTFINNSNVTVPLSSSSALMQESETSATMLELSLWQQNPRSMPNDVKMPTLVGMSATDIRQQATSIGAVLVNRPQDRPMYQAQVNMVFSEDEQNRMWSDASNAKKRMISHDEFLSYAMMEYAKKKDAVDQAKPNDLMMQFLRTARTQ